MDNHLTKVQGTGDHLRRRFAFAAFLLLVCSVTLFVSALAAASFPAAGAPAPKNLSNTSADGQRLEVLPDSVRISGQPLPASTMPVSSGFDFPVGGALAHEGFEMNNCFSCDWLDYIGHTGEDFDNLRSGDPVFSASEGVVVYRGLGPGAWGNVLIVQHNVRGNFIYTQYAHLQSMLVVPGQVVGRRQQIATVGTTGTSAPHLHFEIKDQPIIGHGYTGYPFSGLTVYEWGIHYWAPSWYISNHRHLDSPFGNIDGARVIPGGFRIWGWALDPNSSQSITVHAYLDGQGIAIINADQDRPDLSAAFPGLGTFHGFSLNITAPPGAHEACVHGINIGAGDNSLIECRSIDLTGNPIGHLEGLSPGGNGRINASGWALDPDAADSIDVHFYVNGQIAGATTADDARGDIDAAYPEYGSQHGYYADLPSFPGDNKVCAYAINSGPGQNTLLGCSVIRLGLQDLAAASPPSGRHYYWPFYDGNGGSDWILLASPASAAPLSLNLNLENRNLNMGLEQNPAAVPGQTLTASFRGLGGGPLVATSLTGDGAVAAQRILWAGNSLEEVPAVDESRLSGHFYWTWYDMQSPGMADWVMVANPNDDPVYFEITIAGEDPGPGSKGFVEGGTHISSTFPGKMDGPVEVRAWTDEDKSLPARITASQRVLSDYGRAFNEMPGTPEEDLSDRYLWNWYDSLGSGGKNWVILANPGDEPVYYEITLAGADPGEGSRGIIDPGGVAAPVFPGRIGGPLEVRAYKDENRSATAGIIASQRIVWGPSFGETAGYPYVDLASAYYWTWYDMFSPGAKNWIMLSNPNGQPVYYEIIAGGRDPGPGSSGMIQPQESKFLSFPGMIAGPVEVTSWTGQSRTQSAPILSSQRVLWNGHFNETTGTVLDTR